MTDDRRDVTDGAPAPAADDEGPPPESIGERPAGAFLPADGVESVGGRLDDTARYEGYLETTAELDDVSGRGGAEHLEMLTELELRDDETSDANEAAEEGIPWVPPIDPPVVADAEDPEGVTVAAGFGVTSIDEPLDASHRDEALTGEGELNDVIRDALRADAATSRLADMIVIGVRGGTVVLRGMVEDVDDTDDIVAVVDRVQGVEEVVDEIEVRSLEG